MPIPWRTGDGVRACIVAMIVASGVYAFMCDFDFLNKHADIIQVRCYRFKWALASCALLSVARLVVVVLMRPVGDWLLPRGKWPDEERLQKIEKFSNVSFKLLHMIGASALGFYVLQNRPWVPEPLRFSFWFDDNVPVVGFVDHFPLTTDTLDITVQYYMMFELGYSLHSLLFHAVVTEKRNDFWEMMIHHVATLVLFVFSFVSLNSRIGAVVVFIHDIPDISVYFAKATVDFSGGLAAAGLVSMMLNWMFFRLYVLPVHIVYHLLQFVGHSGDSVMQWYMLGCLCVLVCLHIWWFGLFCVIGYVFVTGKGASDMQERTDDKATTAELKCEEGCGNKAKGKKQN